VKQEQLRRLRRLRRGPRYGMLHGTFIGLDPDDFNWRSVVGEKALLRYPKDGEQTHFKDSGDLIVLAQFDNLALGPMLTHGWRQLPARTFVLDAVP